MDNQHNAHLSRRSFIKAGITAGITASMLHSADSSALTAGPKDPYLGYTMGLGGYGFRHFTTEEAVAMVRGLGLSCISMWPGSAGITGAGKRQNDTPPFEKNPGRWASVKEVLDLYSVRCNEYGVCRFGPDIDENRKIFEFAQANGVQEIGGYPSPDSLDNLDKLIEEYKIPVGIHNHGPGDDWYAKISQVEEVLRNHHTLLGACVDIGHFVRSNEDPAKAILKLGSRVYGVHLKDLDFDDEQTIVGEGRLDILAVLNALQKVEFAGPFILEYEGTPEAVLPPMAASLKNIKKLLKRTKRYQKYSDE